VSCVAQKLIIHLAESDYENEHPRCSSVSRTRDSTRNESFISLSCHPRRGDIRDFKRNAVADKFNHGKDASSAKDFSLRS